MFSISKNRNVMLAIIISILVLGGSILPSVLADSSKTYASSFDRGVSWKPYTPLKKTTFVQFDNETYLDDYAYLSAIPTTVFYDKNKDQLYSNPLLYYQDEHLSDEDKERSLNAYQGIDYFMEDWMSYCNGYLDQMTLINLGKNDLKNDWRAKNYSLIEGQDPYSIASQIALDDWSYSKDAVVAVIEEKQEKPEYMVTNKTTGTLSNKDGILTEHFEVPKTNEVYPTYNEFSVPEGYKLLKVRSWYPSFYFDFGVPGFEGIINMSVPAGDRDLQIYCEKDGNWMMAGITSAWNAQGGMDIDKTSVYVYKSGDWSVALTDVPTKSISPSSFLDDKDDEIKDLTLEPQVHRNLLTLGFGRFGRIIDILKNMRQVMYQIDIEMLPGVTIDVPDVPDYGARNANFKLSWDDPNIDLGFSLIGPSGEEVLSTREHGVSTNCHSAEGSHGEGAGIPLPDGTETDMKVDRLGECLPGEKYQICVFALGEINSPVDFELTYSWEYNMTREEGDGLASASEGAILASLLNAPLLYTKSSELPSCTSDALYKLGVKNICIVDLGKNLNKDTKNKIKEISSIDYISDYDNAYSEIRNMTGRNDVIFSTVDPYSYWHVAELEVAGEWPGALAVGPAAYIAAHHGSPLLIIDNHPELSSSVVWHNELWQRHSNGYSKLPTVSEMYLTGSRIYDFLKYHDFDKEGLETIITVGGQYDIGLPWDRVFVGKGKPGRFIGSPTDLSVWISKNVFYPQLVFQNPALKNPSGYQLINGSSSMRRFPWRGTLGLKITKPSEEETFQYPVLDTLICYDHKFNSRASKYWGFTYKCADGDIPGVTQSLEPIDDGVMVAVNGQEGGFLADMSGSEVQPFYIKQGGFDPVYSTNFDANMYNLNQGVLLWLINTHGGPHDGGMLMFWDVEGDNPNPGAAYPAIPLAGYNKETNPWRGYEWNLGSTDEPDTMTMDIHGILPSIFGNPDPNGMRFITTALDYSLAKRPIRDIIGNLASLPIIRWFTPDWLQDNEDYYDGVIITVLLGRFGTSWYNGTQVDDAIGNIHSAGVSSVACLPAGKYLHLTMMRHGSVFQIMDPWATSWYSDVWQNGVPRGIAMGKTIGEIYTEGISKVGILYISEPPQWWWDLAENVCLYGDPDLRVWVPSTEFSDKNNWKASEVASLNLRSDEEFFVDGHMPFGVDSYPNAREPVSPIMQIAMIVGIVALLSLLVIGAIIFLKKKNK